MKPNHRQNILDDFLALGRLDRDRLMADRKRYGLHFDRRIRELDNEYLIERVWTGEGGERYIRAWIFAGAKDKGQLDLLLSA